MTQIYIRPRPKPKDPNIFGSRPKWDPNLSKKFYFWRKKWNENKTSIKNEINKSINNVYLTDKCTQKTQRFKSGFGFSICWVFGLGFGFFSNLLQISN